MQLSDLVGHYLALLYVTIGTVHAQRLTHVLFREHLLAYLLTILGYQAIGCIHYRLCRAIILLQLEQACPLVLLRKLQYVIDVCSAEGVYALRIVAHHTHVLVLGGQLPYDGMLRIVRVLILVHQHVAELASILGPYLGVLVKE